MPTATAPERLRRGRVHGRYFRENFAQGGIDLVQIDPRARDQRRCGDRGVRTVARSHRALTFGPPDAGF